MKVRILSKINNMREFKLLGENKEILYEGEFKDRLHKEDIKIQRKGAYLNILKHTEYIMIDNGIYDFEEYLDDTMNDEEKNFKIHRVIRDKQGNKEYWKNFNQHMKRKDFKNMQEYDYLIAHEND